MPPLASLPEWTTDAVGLALGAVLVAMEWMAPAPRHAPAASMTPNPTTSIPRSKS
jgi:hypothetical protein